MNLGPDARFWPERMASLAALAHADGLAVVLDLPSAGTYATYVAHNVPPSTRWGEGLPAAVLARSLAQRAPSSTTGVSLRVADGRVADALAVAPVLWKGEPVGVLAAVRGPAFTAEEVETLARVAALIAVEMAELRTLEEDRRQALALYELSRFATLTPDPSSDLEGVAHMLADSLRHDVVGVWVASDDLLHLAASVGYGATPPADLSSLADIAFGQVLRQRRSVSVTFGPSERRPAWAPAAARSFLVAPIGRSQAVVAAGVLVLGRTRGAYASGEDDFAEMLGEYLASMLHKSVDGPTVSTTKERRRIAQELHDGIAQELTGVVLALEGCQRALDVDPGRLRGQLAKAARDARATLSEVRQYMAALRQSNDTGAMNLQVGLSRIVDDLHQSGVRVELAEVGSPRELGGIIERAIVRITSEALRNVAQHSGADKAKLTVRYDDDQVVVVVEDEGKGFDASELDTAEERGHYGIVGIRERAEGVGGELIVRSERGKGAVVRASLPYRADDGSPGQVVVEPAGVGAGAAERGEKANLFGRLLRR